MILYIFALIMFFAVYALHSILQASITRGVVKSVIEEMFPEEEEQ